MTVKYVSTLNEEQQFTYITMKKGERYKDVLRQFVYE